MSVLRTRPSTIKLLVGYAPGGSVAMAARVAADILSAKLSATVTVENLSGAAGVVAAQRVVTSPADGYTLLAGSSNEMAATALVNPTQRYDPQKDLAPVGLIASPTRRSAAGWRRAGPSPARARKTWSASCARTRPSTRRW
jgi:tripartite-type tricarboxylate transporter receptor subunit TctC